jgi:prevent-host-death family protein
VTVLSRTRHGLVGTLPGMRRFGRRSDLTRSVDQVGLAQYNVYEARTHFSRLIERAAAGEEIVIARSGEPLAKLVPYRNEPRVPGVVTAQIVFDAVRLPRGRL